MKKLLFLLVFPLLSLAAQQPFKTFLSASPSATALTGSELMYCDQSNASTKCTPGQLLTYIQANITTPTGANPTGTIGLTAVNGSATTFIRSDAAPQLSQSISPTWTGSHTFSSAIIINGAGLVGTSTASAYTLAANPLATILAGGFIGLFGSTATTPDTVTLGTNSLTRISVNGTGNTTFTAPSSGSTITAISPTSGQGFTVNNNANNSNFFVVTSSGAILVPALASSSSATTGTLCWTSGTGNVTIDTTTTCLASTRKIKQNIKPLSDGLAEIMKLHPISYNLKPENNPMNLGPQVGFISEDVYKIDTRLVSTDGNGDPLGVRYMQLTAVLTKAIQEQQEEINVLKYKLRYKK